jgi:hypothetical protein
MLNVEPVAKRHYIYMKHTVAIALASSNTVASNLYCTLYVSTRETEACYYSTLDYMFYVRGRNCLRRLF